MQLFLNTFVRSSLKVVTSEYPTVSKKLHKHITYSSSSPSSASPSPSASIGDNINYKPLSLYCRICLRRASPLSTKQGATSPVKDAEEIIFQFLVTLNNFQVFQVFQR